MDLKKQQQYLWSTPSPPPALSKPEVSNRMGGGPGPDPDTVQPAP